MQNVIFIQAQTLAELATLSLNPNVICQVAENGGIYRGNPEGGSPIKIIDQKVQGIRAVFAADELLPTDFILECNGSSYDIDLPDLTGMATGQIFYINNNCNSTVNLIPFGTDGIQSVGNFPYPLAQFESVCITAGAGSGIWLILSKSS